jgi:hypothetical protein
MSDVDDYNIRKQAEADFFWENRNEELYRTNGVYVEAWNKCESEEKANDALEPEGDDAA